MFTYLLRCHCGVRLHQESVYDDLADVNLLISSFVHINQSSQEGKVLFPLGAVCRDISPVEACVLSLIHI